MGRKHWHPSSCNVCGKSSEDVGSISQTGKCIECADEAQESNIRQMAARSGPNFAKWRRGMILCAGGHLLDELGERP